MLILLAMVLLGLCVFTYVKSKKDILSPSFVISVLFLISTIFAIAGNLKWKEEVSPLAVTAIFLGLTAIYIGESLGRKIVSTKKADDATNDICLGYSKPQSVVHISLVKLNIASLLSILIIVLYYRRIVAIATSIGYTGSSLITYYRRASNVHDIDTGLFFVVFIGMITALAYICIYIIINNLTCKNIEKVKRIRIAYFIPIVLHLITLVLSSSRSGFITLFVYAIFIFIVQYQRNRNPINIRKAFIVGGVSVIVFFIIFTALGRLTGKTISGNIINNILIYAGSAIVALSVWLNHATPSTLFAQESFSGLRYTLSKFFPAVKYESKFLEFVTFPDGSKTNIYTGFRSYIADFGWIGLIVICILIGLVYTVAYKKSVNSGKPLGLILYGFFFYEFIYILFTPSVTSNLFSSLQVTTVFWIVVLNFLLIPGSMSELLKFMKNRERRNSR